jgi:hypothetical protein
MSTNRISIVFTPQELTDITAALDTLQNILAAKAINLTPDERRQYGSVGDERIAWVHKVRKYATQDPNLVPYYVDMAEHANDMDAFRQLGPMLDRLAQLTDMVADSRLMTGYDIFQNSLAIYNFIRLLATQQNVPGITPIFEDLRKQFPGRPRTPRSTDSPDSGTPLPPVQGDAPTRP